MFLYRWVDPEFEWLAGAGRLGRLDEVLDRAEGELVSAGHKGRDCLRVVTPGHPRPLYIKRERAARTKVLAYNLFTMGGWWSKPRLECEVLLRLRGLGIRCPRPLVCVEQGLLRVRGILVLDELRGGDTVTGFLARQRMDRDERVSFFETLGREVARLHATGFNQPDLYTNHLFVQRRDNLWEFSFLDFQRSRRFRTFPMRNRIRDLGALLATFPRRLADTRDRELLLDAYIAAENLAPRAGDLLAGVGRRVEYLLKRRKIWEIRESDTEEHRSVANLERVESGQVWIDPDFRPALENAGLASFEAIMQTQEGWQMRALKDRENWRLDLKHLPTGGGAFLKKHHVKTTGSKLRARLGLPPRETAGRVEAENVGRLGRGGIAAMRLIAYGEKLHDDGKLESFVLTEELVGYEQLDHFLRRRFPATPERLGQRDPALAQLLENVADVASKFHRLGYNHRDLYCCHFFIKEPAPGEFKVNLIDLQRVEHRRFHRHRWIVKDLAQLAYSAPRERITCAQRMAFFKRYLGVKKLRPQDKRLARQILAKQRLMEWKLGKHP